MAVRGRQNIEKALCRLALLYQTLKNIEFLSFSNLALKTLKKH